MNELTSMTNGGKITVMGTTMSVASSVTVNGTNAQTYGDATFAATNMPLVTTYTTIASDSLGRHSTNAVNVSVVTNNASFQYDGNGNLLYDGSRNFAYDDENQLIQVWVSNQWFSQFSYDARMRRRIRQEFTWQSAAWVQTNQVYYVYDENAVIQERSSNNQPNVTYTRGLDLSSRLQGAGGIGGLLSMTFSTVLGLSSSNSFYYHSDGNGNITGLINPSQYMVAKYAYDAFGNVLSSAGYMAQQNLYRFSSKETHLNSGLVYYLYRYYDPNLQRWVNRDPIEEIGGLNMYSFLGNNSINLVDIWGLLNCSEIRQIAANAQANYSAAAQSAIDAMNDITRFQNAETAQHALLWISSSLAISEVALEGVAINLVKTIGTEEIGIICEVPGIGGKLGLEATESVLTSRWVAIPSGLARTTQELHLWNNSLSTELRIALQQLASALQAENAALATWQAALNALQDCSD